MVIETATQHMSLRLAGEATDIDLDILQGLWSEEQYLKLSNQTNRLIEYTDGAIEVLPMPTYRHQMIVLQLLLAFLQVVRPLGGIAIFAPLRLQIKPGKHREPDLMVMLDATDLRVQNQYWLGADIVVEVVSNDNPKRDTKEKVTDYAEAGIPEYWIVNPLDDTITVLTLVGAAYTEHGVFGRGATATSKLLQGFSIPVTDVFAAA